MQPFPALALIVAGGRGVRAGGGLPKQYRRLGGQPVLRRTVRAFLSHPRVAAVQVVIHPDDEALYQAAVGDLDLPAPVLGGATRWESVRHGLRALLARGERSDAVALVHDAVRPFVSPALIDRCLDAAGGDKWAVVPALPVADSLRRGAQVLQDLVERDGLLRVQTPQCVELDALDEAYDAFAAEGREFTDEAGMMVEAGHEVRVVEGEERNFKLTTEEDFARAEAWLAARASVRTGFGFDVHGFEHGDHVWIGGVRIPHDRALKGHSDADVALHALTDALLGAIAAGDIGDHFPPSDPQWKGAPSPLFLEHARALVQQAGGAIEHVDVTIICEAPKIGPHREAIRARIGALLRLPMSRVSVKATTTERLGFTGRGEGVAAQAVATVRVEEQD